MDLDGGSGVGLGDTTTTTALSNEFSVPSF